MAVVGRVLLMPRGSYVNTDVYNKLDWVRYGGAAWVCKQDNTTGVIPSLSASQWQVLAQDGTVGGWTSVSGKPFETIGSGLYVNGSNELTIATNMTTDKVTIQALNELLTGTGTAGYDAGSGASPRYFPAKFIYNTSLTSIADGDMITIKLPVAGSEYGTYLSIDGGSTYKPIALHDAVKFSTEYGVGNYVTLIYNSNGAVDDIYPVTGGNSTSTITGGAFRVLNYSAIDQTYDGTSTHAQSGVAVAEALDDRVYKNVITATAAAGASVIIPTPDTSGGSTVYVYDDHIKADSAVFPIAEKSGGTPVKFTSCVTTTSASGGYVTITLAEAISSQKIGYAVIN